MTKDDLPLQKTKKLMGALLRMPPKPHSKMKLKPKPESSGSIQIPGVVRLKRGPRPKRTMTPAEAKRKQRAELKRGGHKTVSDQLRATKKALD
jgi:hypothetical protein